MLFDLRDRLKYDPETGNFVWLIPPKGTALGSVAGKVTDHTTKAQRATGWRSNMRRTIRIKGKHYYTNRLAWFFMTGIWPQDQVDHVNLNSLDDSWSNLRLASQEQNNFNQGIRSNNKSGFKGVHLYKLTGRWCAMISIKNKTRNLGYFSTPEQAHEAYKQAAKSLRGDFARYD
jgi:hypothetical protein